MPSILTRLSTAKSVLILGFAREGQSTYRFLRSHYPRLKIALADQKNPSSLPADFTGETFFGDNYLQSLKLDTWNLVVKSPGIPPHLPEIAAAMAASPSVFTSHTELFFAACPGKIIGVTGTKGKSTTASLIHHVLQENGLPSVLVGNIGTPALDYLSQITPSTWVVMELSSYQLQALPVSPHIAVLQNIFPDHLDYHTDFAEYVTAKAHIFSHQQPDDYLLFNADNHPVSNLIKTSPPVSTLLPFHLSDFDSAITTKLLGDHNKYNLIPSVIIGNLLHLPQEKIYSAIATFVPLETRLQLVGEIKHVQFYADTLATIPEATIAAIDALGLKVNTLIAGGHDRKQNYSKLAEKIINSGINTLILFPATGPRIWHEVVKAGKRMGTQLPQHFDSTGMAEAVQLALDHTASGKICLLSPAAPSFTLFKDYRDEFEQYQQALKAIS